MKKKIEEVQEYFKNKILAGEYEAVGLTDYVINLKVDDLFIFSFWSCNGDTNFKQYIDSGYPNFIYLPEFSEAERVSAYTLLKPTLDKMTEEILNESKLEQYNNLQTELKKKGLINV